MNPYAPFLQPLYNQKDQDLALLEKWVNINSGTENLSGLTEMLTALKKAFAVLEPATSEELTLPPYKKVTQQGKTVEHPVGMALHLTKHSDAPIKILLAGHMDTVFPVNSPFQRGEKIDDTRYKGPGAADMKGGLLVMLKALEALEKSPYAGKIGWEVLITPDEEIGSPSSEKIYIEAAKRNELGLIFEPSFADGSLVHERKGSLNFTIVSHGKSAHAGRDFQAGRNAIIALARFIMGVEALTSNFRGISVNVGYVEGGGPVNIVPDTALCKVNVRIVHPIDMERTKVSIAEMVQGSISPDGISIDLFETVSRPPKVFDEKTKSLFMHLQEIASKMEMKLEWKASGGVTDGNILSAAGLPCIDALGVIGGNLHTQGEYLEIDSIEKRAALTASFLMSIAAEGIPFEKKVE